jgi:hypothetical protein
MEGVTHFEGESLLYGTKRLQMHILNDTIKTNLVTFNGILELINVDTVLFEKQEKLNLGTRKQHYTYD